MDRRSFLRLVALGVVGHQLDVDKLLWIPGQKTIFLPTVSLCSLYGIPYHAYGDTGTWFGIVRTVIPEIISSRPMNVPPLTIERILRGK